MLFRLLQNLPFYALLIALVWAFIENRKGERPFSQILTGLLLLLPIGVGGLWWFSIELFFPAETARYLGWTESPFERQLAFGDLATAVGGIWAYFRRQYAFSLAAGTIASVYLLGMALYHAIDIFQTGNISVGNMGWTFSSDVISSVATLVGLYCWKASNK